MRERIFIVDDEASIRGALLELLSSEDYLCEAISNGLEALERIKAVPPDLVITDIRMPGLDGVELLQRVRQQDPNIAFILITAVVDIDTAVRALKIGAYDYITKPFMLQDVLDRIQHALQKRQLLMSRLRYQRELELKVEERAAQLRKAFVEIETNHKVTLEALVAALDAREHETQSHSFRVREYALTLGRALNLSEDRMVDLGQGSLLHDVGKIGITDTILLKPGKLTEADWVEMRKHPTIGYQILSGINFLDKAAAIVLAHQERYDGTGYPKGLRGEEIPLEARIFAVADALDAITSNRPYRQAADFPTARAEIVHCCGTYFDPQVVEAFLKIPDTEWMAIRDKVNAASQDLVQEML
jgi:response regulator RpfG family c-di-GMP phosphodiesterase